MAAALAGSLLALGILVVLRGAFPKKTQLATRLADFNDHGLIVTATHGSLLEEVAVTLLETIKGDSLEELRQDLAVTDQDFAEVAVEKLKAAAGGAFLLVAAGMLFGAISGGMGLLIGAVLGAVVGYHVPDFELKKKAEERRNEFTHALTAFTTLLSSSISGGGGITTAMTDAAGMGEGWVFIKLRGALDHAKLSGVSPWIALEELGHQLRVVSLIELAGSLTLAGASGARVTESLQSRAESSRAKELSDLRASAEAKSSTLGVPVGLMMLGFAVFLGFPAIAGMVGSL